MSGVAAVLHFDGRPVDPAVLTDLVSGPEPAGACAVATWADGPVGIAVGHLQHDAESENVLQVESAYPLVAVWEGRLDNRQEVLERLGQSANVQAGTHAALLLAAYRCWGPACLNMFVGDFALIICHAQGRRLLAARDQLGIRPLHYATDGRTCYIASRPDRLRRRPGIGRTFDERTIGGFLIGKLDQPTATFFAGISRVPAGHLLETTCEGTTLKCYWKPDPDRIIRYAKDSDYTDNFRQLFRQAVESRLRTTEPAGLLLSGGLDSRAVLSTIAQVNGERRLLNDRLATFTATFDGVADESHDVLTGLDRGRLDACFVAAKPSWTVEANDRAVPAWDEPLEGMYVITLQRLLESAQARGVRVLLTGYGGDLVLAGNYYYLFDLLVARRWASLQRELACYPISLRARLVLNYLAKPMVLRRPAASRGYAIPGWIDERFAARTDLRARVRPAEPRACSRNSISHRAEVEAINVMQHSTRMLWQQSEALQRGIELRHPFLDRRLFQFLLAVPVTQKIQDGRSKALLRRAISEAGTSGPLASRSVAVNKWVPTRALREYERANWETCFADARSAALGYIDLRVLDRAFKTYLDGDLSLKYTLARAYRLEMWLQRAYPGSVSATPIP